MPQPRETRDVTIVGAGAAGLLAAIAAARAGVRALLVETRAVPGAKIRVSGGGRCNLLPSRTGLADFCTSGSRNALRNILLSWPLEDVRAFFEKGLGIPLVDEAPAKVFPASGRARDVVEALLRECSRLGVELAGGARVERIARAGATPDAVFRLEGGWGAPIASRRVVLATGGCSLPRTGSDGGGLRLAKELGHSVVPTRPALVPLVAGDAAWGKLAGVTLPARLRVLRGRKVIAEREGSFLFTHRGFSGPVVLDVSRHLSQTEGTPGPDAVERLEAAWGGAGAPAWDEVLRSGGKRSVEARLRVHLPRRLVERLLERARVSGKRTTSEFPRAERLRLVEQLAACPLEVAGDEGYGVAEVTAGGVPLDEVSPRTLESRVVPRLYLAGEMLDVDGCIGGCNFLWAWVSGRLAGRSAARSALP